jgi:hypothetical protein
LSLSPSWRWLVSKVGKGDKIRIGEDPWMGCVGSYKLFKPLKYELENIKIHNLVDEINTKSSFVWN